MRAIVCDRHYLITPPTISYRLTSLKSRVPHPLPLLPATRMAIKVSFSDDPAWTLAKAEVFLASKPVLHNIILTLLHERVASHSPGRYWVAADGDRIVGVVVQSPLDFAATVTPMPSDVTTALVNIIAEAGVFLPGVNGEAATAACFAGLKLISQQQSPFRANVSTKPLKSEN